MKKKQQDKIAKQGKQQRPIDKRPASHRALGWLSAVALVLVIAVVVVLVLQNGLGNSLFIPSGKHASKASTSFEFNNSLVNEAATQTVSKSSSEASSSETSREIITTEKPVFSYINQSFDPESVASLAYCLLDAESGETLATKQAELPLEPASLTKIMTAMLVLEHYDDLSTTIEIQAEDLAELDALGASVAGLPAGALVSVEDILYAIMLPSGADACHAAARAVTGSQEAFVDIMNQKAKTLGMAQTHFTNPTGLPDPDLYSTAADMARLMAYACDNPEFVKIAGSNYHEIDDWGEDGGPLALVSTFFWKFNSSTDFKGIKLLAGKSGFTGLNQCQASYFAKGHQKYILVTLGAYTEDPGSHQAVEDHILIMNKLIK
ncbi:MAG: serine hydrolase [Eubacteriales bacterium]|nr:serine hydrolase [Eubacteriales bacterium]